MARGLGNGRPYPHILPVKRRTENLIGELRSWIEQPDCDRLRRQLHKDFHHLNSSQAMCINLLAPLLLHNEGMAFTGFPRKDVSSQDICTPAHDAFEQIVDRDEGTHHDAILKIESGEQWFIEAKLSESGFGNVEDTTVYRERFSRIYATRLEPIWSDPPIPFDEFVACYQVFRVLSYLNKGANAVCAFVYPRANDRVAWLEGYLDENLVASARNRVFTIPLEDLVDHLIEFPFKTTNLKQHYEEFQKKYVIY